MKQHVTLRAYTSDPSYGSSVFASFTPEDQIIVESLDSKIPVEITLDGLGAGNTIMFITHYGSDLVDALIKVYGTYENILENVTLYITNGHTYHSTEELSEDYFEGIKVVR
jgi:hypothetical protein